MDYVTESMDNPSHIRIPISAQNDVVLSVEITGAKRAVDNIWGLFAHAREIDPKFDIQDRLINMVRDGCFLYEVEKCYIFKHDGNTGKLLYCESVMARDNASEPGVEIVRTVMDEETLKNLNLNRKDVRKTA